MPALSHREINDAILDAFQQSNSTPYLLNPTDSNPRKVLVQTRSSTFQVWIYAWTLTHGGGEARPANEYRVQMTGVDSPLGLNPSHPQEPTLLLGYEPDNAAFVGFDISRHQNFTGRSPSIQVPIGTVTEALNQGFAFHEKGNDEIAVAFRPDLVLAYAQNASVLHQHGGTPQVAALLAQAASTGAFNQQGLQALPPDRQKIVRTVASFARASDFRKRILDAYHQACAITGIQLNLVQAAHILPVGAPGSTDETANGICLSPTLHEAFDRSLVYLDDNLVLRINDPALASLSQRGVDAGIQSLRAFADRRIAVPQDQNDWPSLTYIRMANEFRGIG
jgi:putative restriction endonuclease